MKYKRITVQWWDANSQHLTWVAKDDLPNLVLVETTGYKVRETRQSITICASLFKNTESETFGDCITIPAPWIKKRSDA